MNYFNKLIADNAIKKYKLRYFDSLFNNYELLIDAFTNYYGEENRNIIFERISSTFFYLYIYDKSICDALELSNNGFVDDVVIRKDIAKISKYYRDYHNCVKFTSLSEDILSDDVKESIISYILNNEMSLAFHISGLDCDMNQQNTIFLSFPSIFCDDSVVIHELNHAVRSSILALSDSTMISKEGISLDQDNCEIDVLEEVLNHRIAIDITNSFHELGGCLSLNPCCYIESGYEKLFPLIENFYQKYKDYLKNISIHDNLNSLFLKIDRQIFDKYRQLFKIEFNSVGKNNMINNDSIEYACRLVDLMTCNNDDFDVIREYITNSKSNENHIKILNKSYLKK